MNFNIDENLFEFNHERISEDILIKISTGKAILFTGAGFSSDAKNILGEEPPRSKELAKKICNLGGFPEDEDLRYAADYFMAKNDASKLIDLLKDNYSLLSVGKDQADICSIDWRRFYTTNYDKSIEMASAKAEKVVECIDLDKRTDLYYKRANLCIHLNGSIDSLNEESLQNGFKLSTSSYISADSFLKSDWHFHFKRDLERSNAIIFIGYSLYDIEIQKILFDNQDLREKTYFITREDIDSKTKFTLGKFGRVVTIGMKGFADLINKNKILFERKDEEINFESLVKYSISNDNTDIKDAYIENFLMYGNIEQLFIENAVVGSPQSPYLILRNQLEQVLYFSESHENTIIVGEFGNGKTVFLNELLPYLSVNNINVYTLEDDDGDYMSDIDKLSKISFKSIVILDNYEKYLDLIQYFGNVKPSNVAIVASSRTGEHEKLRPKLNDFNFRYNELNIDYLTDDESIALISIFDNSGLWGSKAGFSQERKKDYIANKNDRQISLNLLSLLDSPQIKDRVSNILTNLMENKEYKETIFAIAFLEVLNITVYDSLTSEIAFNDSIYSSEFRNNGDFSQLFKVSRNKINSRSSLFCIYLIKNNFTPSFIIAQLHKIAKKFSEIERRNFEQERIFKSILKFSFVERMLPETNKKSNLLRYYQELKVNVPWLKEDPHFWLQYGMACIPYKEYAKAQGYFDQSYALAAKRNNYHTDNIDTQQARLFILNALNSNSNNDIYSHFEKAHDLLSKIKNDVYKFRQLNLYREFYEKSFQNLSKRDQVKFEHACKSMIDNILSAEKHGKIDPSGQRKVGESKKVLSKIIETIANGRKS